MKIQIVQDSGLWIAHLPTPYGHMELLCGEGDKPDVRAIALVERFFDGPEDHMAAVRRSALSFPPFWRPIRFAINKDGKLGIQFKHRLTGKQVGMFFADEHSAFKMKRADVPESEADPDRLNFVEPSAEAP